MVCSAKCASKARLDGKTAIVTGANTGIGKYAAADFFKRGAKVIIACRNTEKGNQAVEDILESCKDLQNLGTLHVVPLDLSSLKSVRECATKLLNSEERIDLLVNNAGVFMTPESKTEDGFEMQMGTNHLGHFLFTLLLLPKMRQSTPARIVTVSSTLHSQGSKRIDLEDLNWEKKKYSPSGAYQQSKLANILFSSELARKLKENNISGVTTYSLHPGVVKTDIFKHVEGRNKLMKWTINSAKALFFKTPEQGTQTTIYCSVDEKCASETGLYYAECAVKKPSKIARNEEDARELWEKSWNLVGLGDSYNPFS